MTLWMGFLDCSTSWPMHLHLIHYDEAALEYISQALEQDGILHSAIMTPYEHGILEASAVAAGVDVVNSRLLNDQVSLLCYVVCHRVCILCIVMAQDVFIFVDLEYQSTFNITCEFNNVGHIVDSKTA